MRKSKLYILLSIITLILFFGVAATCNFCGVPVEVGETGETEDAEAKEDSADIDTDDEEDTDAAQESEETDETSEDEAEDDSQEEEVADDNGGQDQEQSQDDNGGSEDEDEYLYLEGSYTAMLIHERSGTVPFNLKDGNFGTTDLQRLIIGEYSPQDWEAEAFLTFDTSFLVNENAIVQDVTLKLDFLTFEGDTSRYESIIISTVYWEDGPPDWEGVVSPEHVTGKFQSSSFHRDLYCRSTGLTGLIQSAVDSNWPIQFKIYFTGDPINNNDGLLEFVEYNMTGSSLEINYIPQ